MPVLADFPPTFLTAVAVAFGLVFGSFLNVVIYRLPRAMSVAWPGSTCPSCRAPIAAYDNIPVFSWLLLLGRARCCKAKISARYPLVEAIGGLYAWAIVETQLLGLRSDTTVLYLGLCFASHLALGLGLVALAFIDLEHLFLPDVLTLGLSVLGLVTLPWRDGPPLTAALIGGAVGFLVVYLPFDLLYRVIRGRVGMGLGDAKLVMLAGVWFGYEGALFALLAGAVQGTLIILTIYLVRGRLDEPDGVRQEREFVREQLATKTGDERAQLERDIASDPVLSRAPSEGLGQSMVPFGPFLVLAIVEFQLFGSAWLIPTLLGSIGP